MKLVDYEIREALLADNISAAAAALADHFGIRLPDEVATYYVPTGYLLKLELFHINRMYIWESKPGSRPRARMADRTFRNDKYTIAYAYGARPKPGPARS
jgi:hypothetical protein